MLSCSTTGCRIHEGYPNIEHHGLRTTRPVPKQLGDHILNHDKNKPGDGCDDSLNSDDRQKCRTPPRARTGDHHLLGGVFQGDSVRHGVSLPLGNMSDGSTEPLCGASAPFSIITNCQPRALVHGSSSPVSQSLTVTAGLSFSEPCCQTGRTCQKHRLFYLPTASHRGL